MQARPHSKSSGMMPCTTKAFNRFTGPSQALRLPHHPQRSRGSSPDVTMVMERRVANLVSPLPWPLPLFRAAAGRNKRGTRSCGFSGGGEYVEEHAHNVSNSDAK
jgi:hypothetical protein